MPSSVPLFQVDAFADRPFAGNPAAVCVLDAPQEPSWMQDVAREMNLSETAFLVPSAAGDAFALRWFTPTHEVDLCGHATLASAHVLWTEGRLAPDAEARFDTRSGRLAARQGPAGADGKTEDAGWIAMDFPADPPVSAEAPRGLLDALAVAGADVSYVGRSQRDVLVQVGQAEVVRSLRPDLARLAEVDARGVIVTAAADAGGEADFVSRFFAPQVGVPEDPVTGSAHCALGPFWAEHLGRRTLVGHQLSARGGQVRVDVPEAGTSGEARVTLSGRAVTVVRGELIA
jgi:PhzF family phenazine biosynthesis protein